MIVDVSGAGAALPAPDQDRDHGLVRSATVSLAPRRAPRSTSSASTMPCKSWPLASQGVEHEAQIVNTLERGDEVLPYVHVVISNLKV
jgi:hypothetical protein